MMNMPARDKAAFSRHMRWHGAKMLVLGLLVLANAYWPTVDWVTFIGILLVVVGLMKMATPACR